MRPFSNLLSRVLVALVAIPLIVYVAYAGGILFYIFVTGVAALAVHEFYGLAEKKGSAPQRAMGILGTILLCTSFFHEKIQHAIVSYAVAQGNGISLLTKLQLFLTLLLLFLVVTLLLELFRDKGSVLANLGHTWLGVVYVGLFMATLIGIRELFGTEFPVWLYRLHPVGGLDIPDSSIREITYRWGGLTIISIMATIWICDTFAYFGGLSMGKHKLFPRVSPKKTWEGAVWGFVGAVAAMIAARQILLPYLEIHQALIIGVIIGVLGQIGDLVESLFKRDAGVKDSSALIPGHGGVFDRFDSLIFVAPVLYLYIDFVVLS